MTLIGIYSVPIKDPAIVPRWISPTSSMVGCMGETPLRFDYSGGSMKNNLNVSEVLKEVLQPSYDLYPEAIFYWQQSPGFYLCPETIS